MIKRKYYKKQDIQKLIDKLLKDEQRFEDIDHDFQSAKCLRTRHVIQINKALAANRIPFYIEKCLYSPPYNSISGKIDYNCKCPYFVCTDNVLTITAELLEILNRLGKIPYGAKGYFLLKETENEKNHFNTVTGYYDDVK